jgi:DNA helicase-2/ATP-dependent DNA helicase PcrA
VGDDAQSIYAFRGADVRNILNFPRLFPQTRFVKLEENYRSTQPVLDLTNAILAGANESFHKHLYSNRQSAVLPRLIRPLNDLSQAVLAARMVSELLHTFPAREIAVLFRAGYQSFNLEVQLNKLGIGFKKYGGLRYTDAAHIKDVMAMARLLVNPLDFPAFARVGEFYPGIGPKTAQRVYAAAVSGDAALLNKAVGRHKDFLNTLRFLDELRAENLKPSACLTRILDHYRPVLEANYADDYPYRQQGLDEFVIIAEPYADLDLLISDLSLEDPGPEADKSDTGEVITLSTVHSAKGLEWSAVLIIDLVQDRFPSRHALLNNDEYEEERRLLYVACTRAKDALVLFAPVSVYNRSLGAHEVAMPSPFVHELPENLYVEEYEGYGGALYAAPTRSGRVIRPEQQGEREAQGRVEACITAERTAFMPTLARAVRQSSDSGKRHSDTDSVSEGNSVISKLPKDGSLGLGYCKHRLFGRGKIVQHIPPDKYRVNFTGFGLKVIMADYLTLEDD